MPSDISYESFASPEKPFRFQAALSSLPAVEYRAVLGIGDMTMAAPRETPITWTQFGIVMSLLLTLATTVVGGGFVWLHSDITDVRISIQNVQRDMNKRLDTLIEQGIHR